MLVISSTLRDLFIEVPQATWPTSLINRDGEKEKFDYRAIGIFHTSNLPVPDRGEINVERGSTEREELERVHVHAYAY